MVDIAAGEVEHREPMAKSFARRRKAKDVTAIFDPDADAVGARASSISSSYIAGRSSNDAPAKVIYAGRRGIPVPRNA